MGSSTLYFPIYTTLLLPIIINHIEYALTATLYSRAYVVSAERAHPKISNTPRASILFMATFHACRRHHNN